MLKRIICPMLVCMNLSSCSVFKPLHLPDIHTYQINGLDNPNTNPCSGISKTGVLQIALMKADAPYDTTNMFYSGGQYELNSYSYHKWVSQPNTMITQAIHERLLSACIYNNVVSSDFMTISQYRLNTQLLELKQIIDSNSSKNSTVHFVVIAQLIDNRANQVLKSKVFIEDAITASNPIGYVAGTNQVIKAFLNDLVAWLK